jgi:class 3 adenylate cyclase/tetratricopeptide (TPR) repeat protein
MKCPKCQSENREGIKFCEECGAKLELECPACKAKIPLGKNFCGACGHKLSSPSDPPPKDLSFDEKIQKIQRYLPQGLTEKILSQRDRIEGERKQVTVMFCDMAGFTALSEKIGPEEAYSIMDQVYEILIHKVHDYEGTVNEMTGDGIMALFGAPIALEDAPQRAIRSSLAIHLEMTRFNDKLRSEGQKIPALKMRIGIHSGPVVVGTLGNDLRVEFKAVGDTVNLTSRIESLAEPGATYVSQGIFKIAEGLFRFEALGEKEVKGKEKPVVVYRVIAPSTRRTRFDVSAERGLTPFVGRARELELLLDGYMRSKFGHGQALSIISEAGVGKSRLLYEFRKAVTNEDATFLEGKCLSYSRGVAYHPIIDILKSNFDVRDTDGDLEIRNKVAKGLTVLGVDKDTTSPYLLELLAVKDSGIDKIAMSLEARKDRTLEALKRIVLKGSEIRPLIMAIEDLHWIDKSSEESLVDLLNSIAGSRVFLIFTYRPEFVHTWGGRSYHSQVNLNRLSNREGLAMMVHILGTDDIEPDCEDFVLEKTEGIPFFIEEFIRSLNDLKVFEKKDNTFHLSEKIQDLTIPATIQEVIMARVDSLPEGTKEVLQIGSVIEREFSYQLLQRLTDLSEHELLHYLSSLKDTELLYERGIYPQSTYIFKHALTREVVYDSILTKKRKQLHDLTGNCIEEMYRDNIVEYYSILAGHFTEGESYEKGAKYSELAAKRANMAASSNEVFNYAKNRVFCMEKLPSSDTVKRKIIDARAALAAYYINYAHIFEAYETVIPIVKLAVEMDYQKKLPIIYTVLGVHAFGYEESSEKGLKYLNEALRISRKTQNLISEFLTLWNMGLFYSWNCQFKEGADCFGKCYEMSRAVNNLLGISASKSIICMWNYLHQGKITLASQEIAESLKMADKTDDIYAKGLAYSACGFLLYIKGSITETEDNLLKGFNYLQKSNQIYFSSWAAGCLGEYYLSRGDYKKAKSCFQKAQSLLLESKRLFPSLINRWGVSIAKAKLLNRENDISLSEVFEFCKTNTIKIFKGWMARDIGEMLLSMDEPDFEETENWILNATETDEQNDLKWHLACDFALYAKFFKRNGDLSKAREKLGRAIELFKLCGADGWVEKYEMEMASLQ